MNTRRTFLKQVGLGAGAFLLGTSRGFAQAARVDRNFVFAYFSGAWDTLLCLDPRDPNTFTDARKAQTKIELAWDQIPGMNAGLIQPRGSNIEFGPTMSGIAPHFDKLCVVRGLSMDTVAHEVGRRFFITGMTPRGTNAAGSAMGTRVATAQGKVLPIPSLVSRVESYNEGDPTFATGLAVNGSPDLLLALQDLPGAPTGAVRTRLEEMRRRTVACDPAHTNKHGMYSLIAETQAQARGLVESGVAALFDFNNQSNADIAAIRMRYGITNGTATTPGSQAALAFQAIKHRVAQSVTIEVTGGLDTHTDWATDHPPLLQAGFDALGQLVTDLSTTADDQRGGTLLDHTTIVVFSEFGRTALMNTRGGRDHSLTNACMLIGAGVPHNRVIGKSSDVGMNPQPVNPMTGAVDDGGVMLSPNNVLASIMRSAGFDTARLRNDGVPALMA